MTLPPVDNCVDLFTKSSSTYRRTLAMDDVQPMQTESATNVRTVAQSANGRTGGKGWKLQKTATKSVASSRHRSLLLRANRLLLQTITSDAWSQSQILGRTHAQAYQTRGIEKSRAGHEGRDEAGGRGDSTTAQRAKREARRTKEGGGNASSYERQEAAEDEKEVGKDQEGQRLTKGVSMSTVVW